MSATTKMFTVKALTEMPFISDDRHKALVKEVEDFQKCIQGNLGRLLALCDVTAHSGHIVAPDLCAPLGKDILDRVMEDLVGLLLKGMPVSGKTNCWSVGGLGSRWIDMDASKYGVDYIRCAFYSKKNYPADKKWPADQPYIIQVQVEKEV